MRNDWTGMVLAMGVLAIAGCTSSAAGTSPDPVASTGDAWQVYPSDLTFTLARDGATWRLEVPPKSGQDATGSFDGKRLVLSIQASTSVGMFVRDFDGKLENANLIQGTVRHRLGETALVTEQFMAYPLSTH